MLIARNKEELFEILNLKSHDSSTQNSSLKQEEQKEMRLYRLTNIPKAFLIRSTTDIKCYLYP